MHYWETRLHNQGCKLMNSVHGVFVICYFLCLYLFGEMRKTTNTFMVIQAENLAILYLNCPLELPYRDDITGYT